MHHMDANETHGQEVHMNATFFWINLGSNAQQNGNYTAIYRPSNKTM